MLIVVFFDMVKHVNDLIVVNRVDLFPRESLVPLGQFVHPLQWSHFHQFILVLLHYFLNLFLGGLFLLSSF